MILSPEKAINHSLTHALQSHTSVPWVIGVSGGVDSMVLYHALKEVFPQKLLHVVHVNHQIAAEAAKWEILVKNTVEKHSDIYTAQVVTCDPPSEDEARSQRYAAFHNTLSLYPRGLLILAHHQDDQEETILWRFLRGAPLQGLLGMRKEREIFSESHYLVRPLLEISKLTIERYAIELSLPFCIDPSNINPCYTRNKIRHQVLPNVPEQAITTTQRLLQHNYTALQELCGPWLIDPLQIHIGSYPAKSLSSLWTLISIWLSMQQCMHPSERSLRYFCGQIIQGNNARIDFSNTWVLIYEPASQMLYKVSSLYFSPLPSIEEYHVNNMDRHLWGAFEWAPIQNEKKSFTLKALTQKDRVVLKDGTKVSSSAIWKKHNIKSWERAFFPAVYDESGNFIQYANLLSAELNNFMLEMIKKEGP